MRTPPAALMLYAAGLGTRMRPLTDDRPKPLVTVAGRALIDHALALVPDGLRVVANSHYRATQLAAHLAGRGIAISHEPVLLDTGGGLAAALPLLDADPIYTLNTDAVWTGPGPLATLAAAWDAARMDALLLVVPQDRATGHAGAGDFRLHPDGRLQRGPGVAADRVYTGAQILTPRLIEPDDGAVFSNNLLWNRAAARGRLFGVVHPGGWCDVGRPDSIPLAEALLHG